MFVKMLILLKHAKSNYEMNEIFGIDQTKKLLRFNTYFLKIVKEKLGRIPRLLTLLIILKDNRLEEEPDTV